MSFDEIKFMGLGGIEKLMKGMLRSGDFTHFKTFLEKFRRPEARRSSGQPRQRLGLVGGGLRWPRWARNRPEPA